MIEFHDTTIAYEGGLRKNECLPSIPHFIQEWAVRDGLSLVNTTSNLTRDTLLYSYGKGIEEGLVTHVFDTDIGHDWAVSTLPPEILDPTLTDYSEHASKYRQLGSRTSQGIVQRNSNNH
jgi:hypothetical protein